MGGASTHGTCDISHLNAAKPKMKKRTLRVPATTSSGDDSKPGGDSKPNSELEASTILMRSSRPQRNMCDADFQQFCARERGLFVKHPDDDLSVSPSASLRASNATAQRCVYANTYRTEPSKRLFPGKVSDIISGVLEEALSDVEYEPVRCAQYSSELSERIKDAVKQLDIPRYKLVCYVCIGEITGQGVRVGSRCVWNAEFDNYAASSFKNETLFAVGVVFASYFE